MHLSDIKDFILSLVVPTITFFAVTMVVLVLRNILFFRFFKRKETPHKHAVNHVIYNATKNQSYFWCIMLGLYFALEASNFSANFVDIAERTLRILTIASATFVIASILSKLAQIYAEKIDAALPFTSLTEHIVSIVVFIIGSLMILNSLGIAIAPILATLGIGGLAVALALQDTLSNLFSGFHVLVSRQVRIGDYIKLESGEEGYVIDINWRTTQVRMLPNNVVLVPNSKLAQAIVINYYFPDKELAVLIEVGVHYKSDLNKVERVTCEVAKDVMENVPGGVPSFEPFIRFHTLGDFSVKFTVILRAKEYVDQYLIKHEFIKRMMVRYAKDAIVVPYPIQAVNLEQEQSSLDLGSNK